VEALKALTRRRLALNSNVSFMSLLPPTSGPEWRWIVASLLAGMMIGGTAVGLLMRQQNESESRKWAQLRTLEATGPRVPPHPGLLGAASDGPASQSAGASVPLTSDLREALRALMRTSDHGRRQQALEQLMRQLEPQRWVELMTAFNQMAQSGEFEDDPGGVSRCLALKDDLFAQMALIDPRAALVSLRAKPEDSEQFEFEMKEAFDNVLAHWAARDLVAALDFHRERTAHDPKTPGAGTLVRAYMQVDPEAALAWAAASRDETMGMGLRQALSTLARRDPQRARELLVSDSWPASLQSNREWSAKELAFAWAKESPVAAFDWANNLPEEVRAPSLEGAMAAWIRADAAAALEGMIALPPGQRTGAINAAVGAVTPENIASVMAAVAEIPANDTMDIRDLSSAALRYREWHPEKAAEWLQSLQPGSTRDSAIKGFVGGDLGETDPEAAASWAAAASDPALRGSLLESAINTWIFHHPDEARHWLRTTNRLADSDRSRLLGIHGQ
jgi:hypothetical protein